VGGLAHFIEEEGVPTTQISLIRLHTEKIKPPRALWVSFELGRPFGVPEDPEFQNRVLLAALKLFESSGGSFGGPVLEDFPEDAPASKNEITSLACPVNFTQPAADLSATDQLCESFIREMAAMGSWYDLAVKKRGRTTVGVSGLDIDAIGEFICSFLGDGFPENPGTDLSLAYSLNLATDDLKAYYFEGVTAQPGQESPSSEVISNWFWQETLAAKVLLEVIKACLKSDDPELRRVGGSFIVPRSQVKTS
jgi:hypothetical protein